MVHLITWLQRFSEITKGGEGCHGGSKSHPPITFNLLNSDISRQHFKFYIHAQAYIQRERERDRERDRERERETHTHTHRGERETERENL